MQYETILVEREGRIAKLILNRPEKLNAINDRMESELVDAIQALNDDDGVGVVVLTGAGRAFCAGGDISEMPGAGGDGKFANSNPEEIRRNFKNAQAIVLGLQRMQKPVIGMMNGVAAGAGFDLSCACDIRVGCPKSRFLAAFIRVGLFPGWGGLWLYSRLLGIPKAAEMLFTGDFLEAEDAYRLGLLNKLVPEDELEQVTMEMAAKIAAGPPIALRLSKLMLYKALEMDLETAMQMSAALETITLTSQDHTEGVAAFREKRKASYQGL
ncbi:MAG: enoyl-CoA hydratase/isomerase family protein [Chloroflexi bacterium]|nr:enoyl-CoA hydratase/isomerase family protein [Chloroflexota bacterium]